MCGIAGFIGSKKIELGEIKKTLRVMRHRGPDADGYKLIKKKKKIFVYYIQD